jgi:hypothetical protein
MKIQFLILSVVLLTVCPKLTFSQDSSSVYQYYELINQAELSIADSAIDNALLTYKNAFQILKKPKTKDLYNATLCASLTNNPIAFDYLEKLILKGYTLDSLGKQKIIAKLISKPQWKKLNLRYPELHKQWLSKINIPLRDSLKALLVRDQSFRILKGSYAIYGDTIKKIDKENNAKLLKIIAKYGYPDDDLVGDNEITQPFGFDIVIWHQTQTNFIYNYTNILKTAVKQGKLDPMRAARLLENHLGDGRYCLQIFFRCICQKGCSKEIEDRIKETLFSDIFKDSEIEKFNRERKNIGLDKLSDYIKKTKFDIKDHNFMLNYESAGIPSYMFSNDKDVINYIEGYTTVRLRKIKSS